MRIFLLIFSLLWASAWPVYAEELSVRYPSIQHPYYAKRDIFFVTLLRMALERSGEPYKLINVDFSEYSEHRSVLLLQSDQYDVHWMNTTAARERELLPVRIPLCKGVIGWRAFFIRPADQPVFDKIDTIEKLRPLIFVQGHDWADSDILEKNSFKVTRAPNWAGLFKIVSLGRAQVFPRSIFEIIAEQKEPFSADLTIEKNIILRYPAAYYFFVTKKNERLKNALERGLIKTIEDGSFDQWFFATFGDQLMQLNLEKRRILSIDNPDLQMPTNDERLWFSIEWFKKAKEKYAKPL
ncbi:MAG: diguanylate cyclase [Moraxellaceae bacterium]|nr:MAG: diguanylate cyclase [Moraxellaceae bacterium]